MVPGVLLEEKGFWRTNRKTRVTGEILGNNGF